MRQAGSPPGTWAACNASLAGNAILRHARGVNLRALQDGDADAWDEAYDCLGPVVLAVARSKLQPYFPNDVDDVAIEALEELVPKVHEVTTVEELMPLAIVIARNRAVSLLREQFSKKRGAGKTKSLEALEEVVLMDYPDPAADSPLAALERKEFAERLSKTLKELKPPQSAILTDLFLNGLSHEEVARKHGIPVGSVGVYRKRGLETLRRIWRRRDES